MVRVKYRYKIKIHINIGQRPKISVLFFFRYAVVRVVPQKPISGSLTFSDGALYSSITRSVQKYYGDLGAASVRFGLKCKYCNDRTRIAIIRAKHKIHRFVNSILPFTSVVSIKKNV